MILINILAIFLFGCPTPIDNCTQSGEKLWFLDVDGDGFGQSENMILSCNQPEQYTLNGTDCNDRNPNINPGEDELCATHGLDDDCDGISDNNAEDASSWFVDKDGDGFGNDASQVLACEAPEGMISTSGDCDDSNLYISPSANEFCNGFDDDCDEQLDEDGAVDGVITYIDNDGDGFGDPDMSKLVCEIVDGYVSDNTDCDDLDFEISPLSVELCSDKVDNNCDGFKDYCEISYIEADFYVYGRSASYQAGQTILGVDGILDYGMGHFIIGSPFAETSYYGPDHGSKKVGEVALVVHDNADSKQIYSGLTGQSERENFGISIDLIEDVDGYGTKEVLIGGNQCDYDSDGYSDGCAYLLSIEDWSVDRALSESHAIFEGPSSAGTSFGMLVSSGNSVVDSDAFHDVAIGAPYYDVSSMNSGAVFLFDGPFSSKHSYLDADAAIEGSTISQHLGEDFSIRGDVNSDGLNDLIIGDPNGDKYYNGRVNIFFGGVNDIVSIHDADLVISGANIERAGSLILTGKDYDGDGCDEVFVGAPGYTYSKESTGGGVYLLTCDYIYDGVSLSDASVAIFQGEPSYIIGEVGDHAGDVNGDNIDDVIWGAGSNGSAHIVLGPFSGSIPLVEASYRLYGNATGSSGFGSAVAGIGDFDNNGRDDVAVSESSWSGTKSSMGAVFVFFGESLPE